VFLDASAIVAIIAMEEDGPSLAGRLGQASHACTSAIAIFEAAVGLARIADAPLADALALVERFLNEANATIAVIDGQTAALAVETLARFGKGCHPAGLNIGDCFAYACARQLDVPLLCKGNDFPRTGIALG
jgi:ribonuclease VapC